jgi:hypothetical protein
VGISLEEDMKKDSEIISLCKDRDVAVDFYRALSNMMWRKKSTLPEDEQIVEALKGTDPLIWSCSWRYAGGIIADIRNEHYGVNEDYLHFYCSGNEGHVSELVEKCFNRLGWIKHPYNDDEL